MGIVKSPRDGRKKTEGSTVRKGRYFVSMGILAVAFFTAAWPARVCAQYTLDVDKNPIIISDRQAITIDRRLLAAAKKANNPEAIKNAKERLSQDIARLKRDLASVKREYRAIQEKRAQTIKENASDADEASGDSTEE